MPTKEQVVWVEIDDWTLILYPFIVGDSDWNPAMAAVYWRNLGTALKQIHQVMLPAEGFQGLHKETFDPTRYRQDVQILETQLTRFVAGSACEQSIYDSWMAHQATIHAMMSSMEKLAIHLRQQAGPLVICHADLHTANIIRDPGGAVSIVDWDDVMLAPRERDFIFVDDSKPGGLPMPFFQGYGETELDWSALAYYRFERAMLDLLECARQVFLRDDLDEETGNAAARLFEAILSPGNEVEAAFRTAARLSL